jgi:MauM/NapG family ferredoxin protein
LNSSSNSKFALSLSRVFQLIFLAAFLILFVVTDYRGQDTISVAVNSFFRADPLVAVSYLLSAKTFTLLLLPALLVLLFTMLLGRFFCGWICPLGTLIDLVTRRIRKGRQLSFLKGNVKYYLLFTLLGAALFNVNLAGIFDPMAILIRFLTFTLYPIVGFLGKESWGQLYSLLGDSRDYLEGGYGFIRTYLLPFRSTLYPLSFLSLLFLVAIFVLERFERRNWCRNLCPLGTLLGLFGSFSLFRRIPGRLCNDCGDCKQHCPTGFDEEILQKRDCILCLECQRKCPSQRVRFKPGLRGGKEAVFSPGRRVFVAGIASGLLASRVFPVKAASETRLLRPPGVLGEEEFLKKCVRCGECMKVCLRSALYPVTLQAGLYGLYTPTMVPRLGYCEYGCNLCGQVCPTGAIPNLPLEEKRKAVIGQAVLDKNHCLPYARKMNCMVCEEHCPIPNKAIRFESIDDTDVNGKKINIKRPYVVEELCNGCGICEFVCPVEEKAGIAVFKNSKRKV